MQLGYRTLQAEPIVDGFTRQKKKAKRSPSKKREGTNGGLPGGNLKGRRGPGERRLKDQ